MSRKITRRGFILRVSSLALASIPLASALKGCAVTGLPLYQGTLYGGAVSLSLPEFPELQFEGGAIQLQVDTLVEPVVVVRLHQDEFIGLSPICTHLGCTVRKERSFFRCPCHGSTYSLDGTVVRGPARERLKIFRSELVGNQLVIHV